MYGSSSGNAIQSKDDHLYPLKLTILVAVKSIIFMKSNILMNNPWKFRMSYKWMVHSVVLISIYFLKVHRIKFDLNQTWKISILKFLWNVQYLRNYFIESVLCFITPSLIRLEALLHYPVHLSVTLFHKKFTASIGRNAYIIGILLCMKTCIFRG